MTKHIDGKADICIICGKPLADDKIGPSLIMHEKCEAKALGSSEVSK